MGGKGGREPKGNEGGKAKGNSGKGGDKERGNREGERIVEEIREGKRDK